MTKFRLFSALMVCGISWGATIPLTKVSVSTGHAPIGLIAWQFLIGIAVLAAICLLRGIRPVVHPQALWYYLIIGLLGTILPNSFSYLAAAELPAGIMAIIIASVPMFTLMIALCIRLERFSLLRMCGVVLGIAAITLLIGPETSLPDPTKTVFVLVALMAPFCYGVEGNFVDTRNRNNIDPVMTVLGAAVIGALIIIPVTLATGNWVNLAVWGAAEKALVANSLIHALVYSGYLWLVSASGAVFASQVAYIVTVSGVLLSAGFLEERYSGWVWTALVLMIIGLALVQPRHQYKVTADSIA